MNNQTEHRRYSELTDIEQILLTDLVDVYLMRCQAVLHDMEISPDLYNSLVQLAAMYPDIQKYLKDAGKMQTEQECIKAIEALDEKIRIYGQWHSISLYNDYLDHEGR